MHDKDDPPDPRCAKCGATEHSADEHTFCPYCGKRKRGWRTTDASLCSACERKGGDLLAALD